jgi:glycosyltransferase involved in cell wall biosynthesis
VDAVVVNTEYMRGNVAVWYGIGTQKIVVIPNGVDIRRFSSSNDGSILDGDPRILYVGALTWTKGIDVLFRAVARLKSELPRMRVHLVGSMASIPRELQLLARKEGIDEEIVFHGWVPHSVLPRYYGSADVCVFPSRLESFGLVILEAMASRVPIVASNIPSFREILSEGKSGLLFECGNDEALSTAILKLANDSVLGSRLSHIAFESVKTYSWENIASKYFALYRRLCERYHDSK